MRWFNINIRVTGVLQQAKLRPAKSADHPHLVRWRLPESVADNYRPRTHARTHPERECGRDSHGLLEAHDQHRHALLRRARVLVHGQRGRLGHASRCTAPAGRQRGCRTSRPARRCCERGPDDHGREQQDREAAHAECCDAAEKLDCNERTDRVIEHFGEERLERCGSQSDGRVLGDTHCRMVVAAASGFRVRIRVILWYI